MDKAEITKYKDNLLTNLRFLGEYDEARGLRKKVLLVEGVTDQKFFGHIKSSDTRCVAVADFMRARNAFSTSRTSEISLYNSKTVITTILKHIAFFLSIMIFPKGLKSGRCTDLLIMTLKTAAPTQGLPNCFLQIHMTLKPLCFQRTKNC